VRLDNVTAILDRVLTTIDRNPQIVQELASGVGSAVEGVGEGAGELVGEGANEAVSDIGSGTGSAVEDLGEGAGGAVEDVGQGAGSAVEDVGEGAGSAVEDVGGGAGEAAGEVGQGAGQAAEQVGDSAGPVAQGATDAASEASGQAGDATQQAPEGAQQDPGRTIEATAASGAQVLSETTDEAGRTVRRVADESGSIVEQTLNESGEVSEEAVVGEADTAGEAGEEKGEVQATPAAGCSCRGQGYLEPFEEDREEKRKELTAVHRAIARLCSKRYVRVIVSTNFDRLLRRALEIEGITPIVIDTSDAAECTSPIPHSGCTIVKVNGDYLETVQRIRQRSSASTTTALMRCSRASSSLKSPRSSPPHIAESTHVRGERVTRHRWNCASSKPLSCASNGSRIN
jgi:hypothetical protein